jgi:hypothetical protein
MNALSTFPERLFFAMLCVVSWAIFALLIAAGGAALLIYALIAELCSSLAVVSPSPAMDDLSARRTASRLCGTLLS